MKCVGQRGLDAFHHLGGRSAEHVALFAVGMVVAVQRGMLACDVGELAGVHAAQDAAHFAQGMGKEQSLEEWGGRGDQEKGEGVIKG